MVAAAGGPAVLAAANTSLQGAAISQIMARQAEKIRSPKRSPAKKKPVTLDDDELQ